MRSRRCEPAATKPAPRRSETFSRCAKSLVLSGSAQPNAGRPHGSALRSNSWPNGIRTRSAPARIFRFA